VSPAASTQTKGSDPSGGVRFARRFTQAGSDPLDEITYELRDSVITNPDGSIVFEMRGAEIPTSWSQLATDIAVSKYFRKAGIFGDAKRGERSVKQLVHRVAHTIRALTFTSALPPTRRIVRSCRARKSAACEGAARLWVGCQGVLISGNASSC
jgi:hypothetical protein